MYNIESSGLSPRPATGPICADCGDIIGDYGYEAEENTWVCEECFKERMEDMLQLCPRELAEGLDILWVYLG